MAERNGSDYVSGSTALMSCQCDLPWSVFSSKDSEGGKLRWGYEEGLVNVFNLHA